MFEAMYVNVGEDSDIDSLSNSFSIKTIPEFDDSINTVVPRSVYTKMFTALSTLVNGMGGLFTCCIYPVNHEFYFIGFISYSKKHNIKLTAILNWNRKPIRVTVLK